MSKKTNKTNKLKKFSILATIAVCLFTNDLYSQGAYTSINVGYGISSSSQNISGIQNTTTGSNSSTYEQIETSLGKGLRIGAAYGYMFNKNLGLELGASYLLGGTTAAKMTSTTSTTDISLSANMLQINPSFVMALGLDKINPYAKFGIIIGSGSINGERNSKYTSTSSSSLSTASYNDDVIKFVYNGGLSFGVNASIGAIYTVNEKMSVFGEFLIVNMAYAPTTGEQTVYTHNGVDKLSTLTIKDKKVNYVNTYTTTSVSSPDTQPTTQLSQKFPFSSIGINVGIRINL